MRIRIESDGNPYTTKVTNVETGELVEDVSRVEVLACARQQFPYAVLTVDLPAMDLIVDAEIKHVCPCCGRPVERTES